MSSRLCCSSTGLVLVLFCSIAGLVPYRFSPLCTASHSRTRQPSYRSSLSLTLPLSLFTSLCQTPPLPLVTPPHSLSAPLPTSHPFVTSSSPREQKRGRERERERVWKWYSVELCQCVTMVYVCTCMSMSVYVCVCVCVCVHAPGHHVWSVSWIDWDCMLP